MLKNFVKLNFASFFQNTGIIQFHEKTFGPVVDTTTPSSFDLRLDDCKEPTNIIELKGIQTIMGMILWLYRCDRVGLVARWNLGLQGHCA